MSVGLFQLKSQLEKMVPSRDGIEELLVFLGYSVIPEKEQLLDSHVLFQQKDMREKVSKSYKLFSQRAQWVHPVSKQTFDVEAVIMLFELVDEQALRSRWPFEISRYVVRFGLRSAQGLFFFVAPNCRSFVVSAYTESLEVPERVQVRRLVVDLDNIARTDLESLGELFYSLMTPATIIERFRSALPYLKVGKAFFQEYHNLFQVLSKRLLKVFGAKAKAEAYGYAQRLLGRITFLYFLQRKGWLDKDRAYLKKRTKGLDGKGLMKFLYELFDILNTEGYKDKSKGVIPYLNGSLFEKEPYSQVQMRQLMDACAPCIRDVLSVFDQYNFTISENTPLDKEVAVDPELLGSLFESMLPEAERGDKGTFYTHQEEMLFMAREALRVYLSRFPNFLTQEQVFYLVYELELDEKQKIEPKVAREVKGILRQIKILDPAVGSGGFLMAVLQIILEIRKRLNGIIGAIEQDYDLKLEVIENNLFGIDIENEAIELARLRLWLSLVVDESVENVRALPNLDYNLHQGDTLRIPEFEKKTRQTKITADLALRSALIRQIAAMREKYAASHGKAKEENKAELEDALKKLIELETGIHSSKINGFSYNYFFPDIMSNGGFDVVLMNPPYIRQEDIGRLPTQDPKTYKNYMIADAVSLTSGKFSPNKQSDISLYFHIRALSLLRDGGVAVVIASSKWLDTRYGVPFKEYLLTNVALDFVFDSVDPSFAQDVNTVITIMRKAAKDPSDNLVHFIFFRIPFRTVTGDVIHDIISQQPKELGFLQKEQYRLAIRTQKSLYEEGLVATEEKPNNGNVYSGKASKNVRSIYVGTKWGNLHLRAPEVYYKIIEKAKGRLRKLGETGNCTIRRGFTTGCDDFFILRLSSIQRNKKAGFLECENGFGYRFLLEEKYCLPLLNNIGEISGYIKDVAALHYRIFFCRENRNKLRGTAAEKYIEWAEKSPDSFIVIAKGKEKGRKIRINECASVVGRKEWYQLPDIKPSKLYLPRGIKNRQIIPMGASEFYSDQSQYAVYCRNEIDYWLFFSSSIFRLFMELYGEIQGAGALVLTVEDYRNIPVLYPLPEIRKEFRLLKNFVSRDTYRIVNIAEQGPLEFEQNDRKELDDVILKELGFKDKEERQMIQNEIYDWLKSHVLFRLGKPKRAPSGVAESIGKRRFQTDLREFQ